MCLGNQIVSFYNSCSQTSFACSVIGQLQTLSHGYSFLASHLAHSSIPAPMQPSLATVHAQATRKSIYVGRCSSGFNSDPNAKPMSMQHVTGTRHRKPLSLHHQPAVSIRCLTIRTVMKSCEMASSASKCRHGLPRTAPIFPPRDLSSRFLALA